MCGARNALADDVDVIFGTSDIHFHRMLQLFKQASKRCFEIKPRGSPRMLCKRAQKFISSRVCLCPVAGCWVSVTAQIYSGSAKH